MIFLVPYLYTTKWLINWPRDKGSESQSMGTGKLFFLTRKVYGCLRCYWRQGGLPILLPYAVVGAMGASLTTKQGTLAQMLNESLANSDTSFSGFISLLPKPSSQTSKGSYCVNFYDPIKSFWVKRDYYYIVG